MPLQRCQVNGKPGWRWGQRGKCYTYASPAEEKAARKKAMQQAVAMSFAARREGRPPEVPV